MSPQPALERPGLGWMTFIVFHIAALTLWLLTYPFNFQERAKTAWLGEWGFEHIHKINLASNLIIFMPLGCAWMWRRRLAGGGGAGGLVTATLLCAAVSLLGETLQTRLPERTSSAIDLLANVFGGACGALIGGLSAGVFLPAWRAAARWLGPRPRMQRTLIALTVLLAARAAPFDVSLETYYLRVKWEQETKLSVLPFAATRNWLSASSGASPALQSEKRSAALNELGSAATCALLFIGLAGSLNRARLDAAGPFGCAWGLGTIAACLTLVFATEVMQFFVRSRLMDSTDPVAGAAGIVVGMLLESVTRPRQGNSSM